ncbi:MAG TPA: ABC transporter ATP-binding protein [Candidatus Paceibacterota bacterium]|nr:ABC transporter ATP-binding protein [Candidatus Paceibacterota bacterium]
MSKETTPIIEVRGIGKKYDIRHSQGSYVALRDVLMNVIKRPFSFFKAKAKQVAGLAAKEEFWALRDVSFDVEKGEVVGIIGRNGAGKSTLLKILTGITPPTEGEIKMRGHVASLLEIGTGFHPELTGRENIFLNGAILGMSKKDIARNFDSIVKFAEIEKFLDTPVKYYSSGMYVRLAFSVASHMEPDILLVDEVLAVGDAEFQKKCLGKMEEVTRSEGRTILFVSHNLSAIKRLCKKTVLIEKGRVKMYGDTEKVVNHYLSNVEMNAQSEYPLEPGKKIQATKIRLTNESGKPTTRIPVDEDFFVEVEYEARESVKAVLSVIFFSDGEVLLWSSDSDKDSKVREYAPGKYKSRVRVPGHLFNVGMYYLDTRLHRPGVENHDMKQGVNFEIIDAPENPQSVVYNGAHPGKLSAVLDYKTEKAS